MERMMTPDEAANVQALSLHAIATLLAATSVEGTAEAHEVLIALGSMAQQSIDTAHSIIARYR